MRFVITSQEFIAIIKKYLRDSREHEVPEGGNVNFQQAKLGNEDIFVIDALSREELMAAEVLALRDANKQLADKDKAAEAASKDTAEGEKPAE